MAKTILITGTSSGYGKTAAQYFLDRGWNVVAAMRRPDSGVLRGPAERLRVVAMDVTRSESIEKAIADGIAAFGGIDVLVNNAGIGLLGAFEATPEKTMREIFETNTFGAMAVCRGVIPHMRERGSGTIINVTSSAGIAPMPLVAIYVASKSAMEGFTESLSYELGMLGIRVRLVEPGLAPTTSFGANGAERMHGLTPSPYAEYAGAYLKKMMHYPAPYTQEMEVAEAVFAAATEEGDRLRYLAGADTKMFAEMRWAGSEEAYLEKMRGMFGPRAK